MYVANDEKHDEPKTVASESGIAYGGQGEGQGGHGEGGDWAGRAGSRLVLGELSEQREQWHEHGTAADAGGGGEHLRPRRFARWERRAIYAVGARWMRGAGRRTVASQIDDAHV